MFKYVFSKRYGSLDSVSKHLKYVYFLYKSLGFFF
jgi:hypothetical protein